MTQLQSNHSANLKDLAKKLRINYSTAKTIVQTFRREKRFATREKILLNTKREEKLFKKNLNKLPPEKIYLIMTKILKSFLEESSEEMGCNQKLELSLKTPENTKQTIGAYSNNETPIENEISKIDNSHPTKTSIGTTTNDLCFLSPVGDIFYIHDEENVNPQYDKEIDFENLVHLRKRVDHPDRIKIGNESNKLPLISGLLTNEESSKISTLKFNFYIYSQRIVNSFCQRYHIENKYYPIKNWNFFLPIPSKLL